MERLDTEQTRGLTRAGLRKWGILFVILGIFGRCVIQNHYLGIAGMTSDQLLDAMTSGSDVMMMVTVSLVIQFIETMATPIFCLLLADGFVHTSNAMKYMGRVLGVAVISELPFNFAMGGKLFDLSTRNPVFGLAVAAILLYLYGVYSEKKAVNFLLKAVFTLAAVIWCGMLKIENGIPCVILTCVFWAFRNKPNVRNLVAGVAAMFCSLFSIFYMISPMGMMVLHFYNGEKGEENDWVKYLFYPAALLIFGIAGAMAF